MTGNVSAALRQQILTALLKQPAQAWLAAHTGDPGPDGAAYEVAGNGYQRRAVTPTDWTDVEVGADGTVMCANAADLAFPPATGEGWGSVTALSLWTAETGGVYRATLPLREQILIKAGDRLELPASELVGRWRA